MSTPNLRLLSAAAEVLQPVLDEIVFVGGCMTGLLIRDEAAATVRSTYDVDAVVEIASYGEYVGGFSDRLRELGLREDTGDGAVICRWRHGDLVIDLMPVDSNVLGFSNAWYAEVIRTADRVQLPGGREIQMITAPAFVATKLVAFRQRGKGDILASHDLEDIVAVIDGRDTLLEEIRQSSGSLVDFVSGEFSALLSDVRFSDALPGFLQPDPASQARLPIVLGRLKAIAALNS